jgi:hypothetical protein
MGTDEVQFNRIFASESFAHLNLVFEEYRKLAGKDIEHAIKNEMTGDVERAFLCIGKQEFQILSIFVKYIFKFFSF